LFVVFGGGGWLGGGGGGGVVKADSREYKVNLAALD
jgi:hypothetical protein